MTALPIISGDRLEDAWRKLGALVRERERELAELKREFLVLDEARALLIMRSDVRYSPAMSNRLPVSKPKMGLLHAVIASVRDSEEGLTLGQLCEAVQSRVSLDRYANERSFVAAVQTTVRRLMARSHLALSVSDGTTKYMLGPEASVDGAEA
jgi:hypothetical protein